LLRYSCNEINIYILMNLGGTTSHFVLFMDEVTFLYKGEKIMKEKLEQISKETIAKIEELGSMQELQDLRVKVLGKKGELTEILRGMKDLSPEERPVVGAIVNVVRDEIEAALEKAEEVLAKKELEKKLEEEKIDITLPSSKITRGSKHPINRTIEQIQDLFVSMGYDVVDGPELETDEFCFERLNLPKGHPARDMQDSFYITPEDLLRTQTSAVQARVMLANEEKSPIRMVTMGKTYRREDDATHSHQFNQVEGLVIDKKERNVSLADLKGTLEVFVKEMLGDNLDLRFRPSYFPFTEPSYEVDVTCFKCGGKGCNLCKQTGWIEILGAGIVHPNVLAMNGYDPEKYSGFAFGTGIDRLAMFKYGITDMRYLYANDVRFLNQFDRKD